MKNEDPYFVLRGFANYEDSAYVHEITKGTYKRDGKQDMFTFIVPTKTHNVTWMFGSSNFADQRVVGVLEDVNGNKFGLFFQPDKDARKSLKTFLQENEYICHP